jgi:hypothetical protein
MANQEHLKILMQGVESWNEWREEYPEIEPNLELENLSKVNLSGAELKRANLKMTDLKGANLSYAYLVEADLSHALLTEVNLSKAIFDKANLEYARFFRADLTQASLTGANLNHASFDETNFQWANLDYADFSNSSVGWSIFAGNDLSKSIGLNKIKHLSACNIDIDTIYTSRGRIPESFLRGCGIPENFITHMQSLVAGAQPIEFYSCFISYSYEDKSFARRLHDALQGRGIRCWLDEHQLLPGDKIYTEVDRGIRLWDKVLLCCSKESLQSWWVENEIQIAFEKEQQLRKQRGQDVLALIPLNLDGYLFGGDCKHGLAAQIRARLAADFTGWETDNSKFESEFEKLVKALRADAGGRESPPQSRL